MPSVETPLVVIDSNTIVSAAYSFSRRRRSPERELIERAARGEVDLLMSEDVFAECEEVLQRPKFNFDPVLIDDNSRHDGRSGGMD